MYGNSNRLSSIEQKIIYICNNKYFYFLNKSNVVGIGLDEKVSNGFYTNKKCIKIFVSNKVNEENLSCENMIPKMYEGIETDVIEIGNVEKCSLTNKIRPAIGGYSIGSRLNKTTGSLGCVVTDGKNNYILSNNHIMADENTLPIGTDILQPSISDGGRVTTDTIASLYKFVPLKFNTSTQKYENCVDCAIAKITDETSVSSKIAFVGQPKGIKNAELYEDVIKVGRTTEKTKGLIIGVESVSNIGYKNGVCTLKHLIVTSKMAEKGDSGSVLIDENNYVIGLLCSASQTVAFFNPINLVLGSLNVDILTH